MLTEILILIMGVIAILLLANLAVRNSIQLADHFGLSGTFIGLTILSIGTSIPEIMTAVLGSINILNDPATMNTVSGLIIGTNVGSDIFQQSFILALVGLIGTITVVKKNLVSEVGALIAGAVLILIFSLGGFLNRFEGFILLAIYFCYLIYLEKTQVQKKKQAKRHLPKARIAYEIITIVIAFAIMAFAANKVIDVSTLLVSQMAISASFFGVLLLGVASALPELTTALIGILKHKKGISSGVLIGSNVTNPLMGLGAGALISGYAVPNVTIFYDLPAKIGIACLIFYFLWKNEYLRKWQAVLLIFIFIAYLYFRSMFFPVDF